MENNSSKRFVINEINCKSILNRSRIPDLDYTINPYTGCLHGCVYCYARFMVRYTQKQYRWGSFVDIKINALEILKKQFPKFKKGKVSLSTVTDPYQAVEAKYEITRKILEQLAENRFPVSILTKSNLVERDIDILRQLNRKECEVGFSISTLNEKIRRNFEPHAPPIKNRIQSLKTVHRAGIKTWVFIAPVLPGFTEESLYDLLMEIKGSVDYIMLDRLNVKYGNWPEISRVLSKAYPRMLSDWKNILLCKKKKKMYYEAIEKKIFVFAIIIILS